MAKGVCHHWISRERPEESSNVCSILTTNFSCSQILATWLTSKEEKRKGLVFGVFYGCFRRTRSPTITTAMIMATAARITINVSDWVTLSKFGEVAGVGVAAAGSMLKAVTACEG